ncbi:hypothetical protein PSHT_08505 [Puccinia striiformis]|uniref:C2H2-type domain-containing protein n=1 Tax=Puccinia striiformis TaxID=27350 RepID=A0A2S4VPG3_9BASI|nr:hypothetical protein PSHT_08505 [Puccinia striiformis]
MDIDGFIQHQTNKGEFFECTACGPKLMRQKQTVRHKQSVQHKKKVDDKEIENDLSLGLEEVESSLLVRSEEPNLDVVDFEFEQSYSPRSPNSPNAITDSLNKQFEVEEAIRLQNAEDNPDIPLNNQIPEFNWHEYVEYELERILEDSTLDDLLDEEVEEEETIPTEEDHKQWAPFRSKMDFVGCLLVGYTRNLLSRTLFDQIRLILNELCHLKIPAWSSIRWSQKRIRDLLGLEVKMQESVWGMPCAVLSSRHALQQDLANPLVSPHIDFYPEDTKGVNQYKLSQSQKWLTLSPSATSRASYQLRIPQNIKFDDPTLLTVKTKEFAKEYSEIKRNNLPLSTICANKIFEVNGDDSVPIQLPNSWRKKAGGKILRKSPHQPAYLQIYPTKNTTVIFLPRQIAQPFWKSRNFLSMSSKGFEAYDASISQPVFVMCSVLFFLGDSPMHSEITNTHYPGSALNPCRICGLSALTLAGKHRKDFVYHFFHRDRDGNDSPNDPRVWKETINRTHELFKVATEDTMKEFETLTKEYGVKDRINERFIEDRAIPLVLMAAWTPLKLSDTQKAELEGRIESFNTSSLNMPMLQPIYLVTHVKSLIGKEFKIFLQAAPFILFPFMNTFEREIWLSLSTLSPYAFQTHINDMADFQLNLQKHVSNFLYRIVRLTAQWVNKPKFHMILHLGESIRRFGPATLFATEKFESFNGVVCYASTHSNRLAPGRDIAIKLADFNALRFSLSGGITYNNESQTASKSSPAFSISSKTTNRFNIPWDTIHYF